MFYGFRKLLRTGSKFLMRRLWEVLDWSWDYDVWGVNGVQICWRCWRYTISAKENFGQAMEQAQEGCMLEAANLECSSHLINSLIMKSQMQSMELQGLMLYFHKVVRYLVMRFPSYLHFLPYFAYMAIYTGMWETLSSLTEFKKKQT